MKGWLKIINENRCGVLLAAFLVNLTLHPFLVEGSVGRIFIEVVRTVLLFSAVYAVAENRLHFRVSLTLALVSTAAAAYLQSSDHDQSWIIAGLSLIVAYLYITGIMLQYVLRNGRVTADKLLAAVCIYFFLGFIWTRIYHCIEIAAPGSFQGISTDRHLAIDDLNYFSFVTLTTLGYGDISPKTPQARCFVIVQAVTGVLYIAILISRLAAQFRRANVEE